ncbi:hypothetical protein V9T40_013032 [Parthenolecanium corni]|uniref:C2 domain-containing protein n=1 Tax=Parthenolecanium corni TaxID=536013 RepID=A0AAN9TA01_9HEMI
MAAVTSIYCIVYSSLCLSLYSVYIYSLILLTFCKSISHLCISDPYVKIYLICGNKRIRKKRTSVKHSTLNPVYNEAVTFDVPSANVEEVSLIVKVIDYDRIGYDELMGCVGIGTSYNGTGRDHWLDMLDNPRKPVAQWYTLMDSIPGPSPPTNSSIRFNCLTRR